MPLSINVGLSRKASKDYQSTGYSINVTAELDQSLLARPEELQTQVANLYQQAEQALDRQAGGNPAQAPPSSQPPCQEVRPRPNGNGNGAVRPNARVVPATESQKRAIQASAAASAATRNTRPSSSSVCPSPACPSNRPPN